MARSERFEIRRFHFGTVRKQSGVRPINGQACHCLTAQASKTPWMSSSSLLSGWGVATAEVEDHHMATGRRGRAQRGSNTPDEKATQLCVPGATVREPALRRTLVDQAAANVAGPGDLQAQKPRDSSTTKESEERPTRPTRRSLEALTSHMGVTCAGPGPHQPDGCADRHLQLGRNNHPSLRAIEKVA